MPDSAMPTLKKSGKRNIASAVMKPPPECPHIAARKMLVSLHDPSWGNVKVAGNPVKLSGLPDPPARHPPDLGEHSSEVLHDWLGANETQVADWKARRVI